MAIPVRGPAWFSSCTRARSHFFHVGVLPPLLLLGLIKMLALVHTPWVAETGDALIQAVVSGLAHRAGSLLAAYLLALAVLAIRQRVARKRRRQAAAYSKRSGSPSSRSTL